MLSIDRDISMMVPRCGKPKRIHHARNLASSSRTTCVAAKSAVFHVSKLINGTHDVLRREKGPSMYFVERKEARVNTLNRSRY